MGVTVETHNTGDPELQRDVVAIIEHVLSDRPGDWRSGASASDHCVRLPRYDLGQRPLNSIHFFTNHPDRLLIARTGHRCDCFYRLTNLAVAIPNQVDSRGSLHSVLVNPSSQFRSHPGER